MTYRLHSEKVNDDGELGKSMDDVNRDAKEGTAILGVVLAVVLTLLALGCGRTESAPASLPYELVPCESTGACLAPPGSPPCRAVVQLNGTILCEVLPPLVPWTRDKATLNGPCRTVSVSCGDQRQVKGWKDALICPEIVVTCLR